MDTMFLRRGLLVATLLFLPSVNACVPFLIPTHSLTRPLPKEVISSDVHAFRVDVRHNGGFGFHLLIPYDVEELTPLEVGDRGLAAQSKLAWTTGLCYGLGGYFWSHTVQVRLYRPGYQLITVPAWDGFPDIAWKPARDVKTQQAALDQLFRNALSGLAVSGSGSTGHRDALLFGASEYDRLAAVAEQLAPADQEFCQQLRDRAQKLHELAGR